MRFVDTSGYQMSFELREDPDIFLRRKVTDVANHKLVIDTVTLSRREQGCLNTALHQVRRMPSSLRKHVHEFGIERKEQAARP
jgi:hypothetical protein